MDVARILVVDDDPGIREVVSWALEDEGYSVQTARDGAEALVRVRDEPPDGIVLDLNMPVMDGWAFLRACRADPTCKDVPILLMSAGQSLAQGQEVGAAAFLTKPFDLGVLVTTLVGLL